MNALLQPRFLRRPMTHRDIDTVIAVESQSYAFPWSRGNFVDSLAAGYPAEVLECDELVGYFVALPGVDELHLLNLTVAPRWQGQGHGSGLLEAVKALARAQGLSTLWLEVRASNQRARALYARRGFAEVSRRRRYYPAHGGREDAIVMSLALGGDAAARAANDGGDALV